MAFALLALVPEVPPVNSWKSPAACPAPWAGPLLLTVWARVEANTECPHLPYMLARKWWMWTTSVSGWTAEGRWWESGRGDVGMQLAEDV